MSDYLKPIVENFDPVDYVTPKQQEMEEVLPDEPDTEDILEAHQSLRSQCETGGAILTARILGELLHLSIEVHETLDKLEQTFSSHSAGWSQGQKDDVHLFFAFVGQVQEYLLRKAVLKYVINDEARTEKMKKKILGGDNQRAMPAGECMDYLNCGGILSDGLKGEIGQVRNERNEEVHDITRWLYAQYKPQELRAQVARGERSVVKLLELVYKFDLD